MAVIPWASFGCCARCSSSDYVRFGLSSFPFFLHSASTGFRFGSGPIRWNMTHGRSFLSARGFWLGFSRPQ